MALKKPTRRTRAYTEEKRFEIIFELAEGEMSAQAHHDSFNPGDSLEEGNTAVFGTEWVWELLVGGFPGFDNLCDHDLAARWAEHLKELLPDAGVTDIESQTYRKSLLKEIADAESIIADGATAPQDAPPETLLN